MGQVTVSQRMLNAQAMERRAVKNTAATESEIGEQVRVRINKTKHVAVFELGKADLTLGVQRQFGEAGTAVSCNQAQVSRLS